MLMMHLWESDSFIDDNTLTVNVTRPAEKTGGGRTYRLYPDEKGCRLPDRMTEAEQEKKDGTTERGNPAGVYAS